MVATGAKALPPLFAATSTTTAIIIFMLLTELSLYYAVLWYYYHGNVGQQLDNSTSLRHHLCIVRNILKLWRYPSWYPNYGWHGGCQALG